MKVTFDLNNIDRARALTDVNVAFHVVAMVTAHYKVSAADLEGADRHWEIVWPRWVAIALVRRHTALSSSKIGTIFNRDHASILHAVKSLENHIQTNAGAKASFDRLDSICRSEFS